MKKAILISALGALLVALPVMAEDKGELLLPEPHPVKIHGPIPQPFKEAHPRWQLFINATKFALDVLADVALIRNGRGL